MRRRAQPGGQGFVRPVARVGRIGDDGRIRRIKVRMITERGARDRGAPRLTLVLLTGLLSTVPASAPGAAGGLAGGSVLDGVFTAAQAARGERTFEEACAGCHDTGEFAGARFRLSWVDRTVGELFDTISTLMPEGDPGSLRPGEYAALVAYLLQMNGYPPGETPLPSAPVALEALNIVEAP